MYKRHKNRRQNGQNLSRKNYINFLEMFTQKIMER